MNAVIYARYSSNAQTEQSIEGQLRVCKEYAKNNGHTIINDYIDRAISGTTDNRPAFLQMINDAKQKNFQYIIVYKLDRFARNKYDSVFHKHNLNKLNIKVLSATEAISDTPEGKLVEGLLEMMAEMYSQDLSQKVKRGINESLRKGNFIGGNILYGYKVENKKILIDNEKAQVIKYLFNEYAQGKQKKQIIQELNEKGYRTQKGKLFTITTFHRHLKNKKYIGEYNKNDIDSPSYPPIIDKETFDKVQVRINKNKQSPATSKAKNEYILSGKIFCGYCSASMYGISGTSRTKQTHHYYACKQQYKQHTCKKKYEKKEILEQYIVNQTLHYVLREDIQEQLADYILQEYKKNITGQKINKYELQIKQIDKDIDKCFDFLFNNQNNTELCKRTQERAKDLENQKIDLVAELQKLKLANHIKHDKQSIITYLQMYIKGNELDLEHQKRIINSFVNSIYLFDDKLVVYYNLFGLQQVTYEQMLENIEEIEQNQKINMVHISNPLPNHKMPVNTGFFCVF